MRKYNPTNSKITVDESGRVKFKYPQENISEAKMKDLLRKHKRELQKAQRSGNLELSKKAEEDLMQWAMDAGEIKTDDPDDFSDWLDDNLDDIIKGRIKEDVDLSEAKFNSKKESIHSQREVNRAGCRTPSLECL